MAEEKLDVSKLIEENLWVMRDIPWTSNETFGKLTDLLEEDIKVLAMSVRESDGVVRGTCIISPEGIEKLKAEQERRKR